MENPRSVDQRRAALDAFIAAHRERLARGGTVVEKWRRRRGRRIGPFMVVTLRDSDGGQRAHYLGRDAELVAHARRRLDSLQAAHRQRLAIDSARRCLRRGLVVARRQLDRELAKIGLRLQGAEVRGWSARRAAAETVASASASVAAASGGGAVFTSD